MHPAGTVTVILEVCVMLPVGQDSVTFKPGKLKTSLPDASKPAWPMGAVLPNEPFPRELDMVKVKEAVEAAMAGNDLRRRTTA